MSQVPTTQVAATEMTVGADKEAGRQLDGKARAQDGALRSLWRSRERQGGGTDIGYREAVGEQRF
jgi:hypothetical protein